jgi:hypothetical protein
MRQSSVCSNIYVDGNPYLKGALGLSWAPSAAAKRNASNYEAVLDYMLSFLYTKFTSSRVILAILHSPRRKVIIRPRPIPPPDRTLPEEQQKYDQYNAGARVEDSKRKDAFLKGEPAPAPGKDETEDRTLGTGLGTDAVVLFNPGVYADAMGQSGTLVFRRSDHVLLHELVHGLSDVSGVSAEMMGAPAGYDNLEEFTAIVVTNVYVSEIGGPISDLVGGHDGRRMPPKLNSGQAFYNEYPEYMQTAYANHRWLTRELKSGGNAISHNPFVYCIP